MTREELLNKEVIKVKDIESAFGCSYNKATQIIRAIKHYSDRLEVRGAIHVLDYMEYWEAKSKHKKRVVEEPEKFDNYSCVAR